LVAADTTDTAAAAAAAVGQSNYDVIYDVIYSLVMIMVTTSIIRTNKGVIVVIVVIVIIMKNRRIHYEAIIKVAINTFLSFFFFTVVTGDIVEYRRYLLNRNGLETRMLMRG